MSLGRLTGVALPQLEQLLRLVRTGDLAAPLSLAGVQSRGLGPHWPDLEWLASLDRSALEAVLAVAIAERTTRPVPRLELVWTGPEAKVSAARDTAVVVRELFHRAQRSVLVAGFAFKDAEAIFNPLHAAMRDRSVDAHVFLHIDDRAGIAPEECARLGAAAFVQSCWPFGTPFPTTYYDPRTVAPGSSINLHAKCIVIDNRFAMIGSANFTHNAHARNIEVGVLIEDAALATDLATQWQRLIHAGLVRRCVPEQEMR